MLFDNVHVLFYVNVYIFLQVLYNNLFLLSEDKLYIWC